VSKRRWAIRRLIQFIRDKRRVSVTKAALVADYSLEYFKRHVMPLLLELADCIDYDVTNQELYWACEEEGGEGNG